MNKLIGYEKDIHDKRLISAQINLLNKCTSKCAYCRKYTWPDDTLDFEVLKKTIGYMKYELGLRTICFSGGDPILYPHIVELLEYCDKLNIKTSLITTLLTKDMKVLTAIANYAYRIHTSVDAIDNDTYSKARGVAKAYPLLQDNILFVNSLRINKLPIRISTTISKLNVDQLYNIYHLAKYTKSTLNYYFVHIFKDFDFDKHKCREQLSKVVEHDIEHITNAYSILNGDWAQSKCDINSKYCDIPYIHCAINANGDLYPCCNLLGDNDIYGPQLKYVYGNIYAKDLAKQFANRFNTQYDVQLTCNGCWERYNNYIDDVHDIIHNKDYKEIFL